MKYVIVGGVAGGATATAIIRLVCRGQPKASAVTIIWKRWSFSFSEYSHR